MYRSRNATQECSGLELEAEAEAVAVAIMQGDSPATASPSFCSATIMRLETGMPMIELSQTGLSRGREPKPTSPVTEGKSDGRCFWDYETDIH